ncbi:Violaxanthin de-epoxidase-domain-containing protein [Tribonema minus]|uniref:Violaxanthin de-epoxidase-domain-containing protein n=1 Tax=Tribonema minus TaxID=303371 RepID=A0A835YUF5_9STRA|nr:Violaxanthin de-epoxidase-domain-containing protein [Tribonema minus]
MVSPAIAEQAIAAAPGVDVTYDGFADYAAKGKKMDESDVGCFANECGKQTRDCFTDGSCLKGVTCLGRCKGEQCATRCFARYGGPKLDAQHHDQELECATRCFAQYGGPKLDAWLSCTLEDHECVKIPKDLDFSAIDKDPPAIAKSFDPTFLEGTWYKVLGVNPKYDLFDCQRNTFAITAANAGESGSAQVAVEFRLAKPEAAGGGFWQNRLSERLEIDPPGAPRTFHTEGKMFGLTFRENWYVAAAGAEPGAEFVLVRYRGHTLQGTYDGGFVYAREPALPQRAAAAVRDAARVAGLDPAALLPIDNACPREGALPTAGEAAGMGPLERLRYEAGFLYDLLEWVRPGTINKYD